jgi:peptide/nickel transport system substrate-binding protein/oligopeptide transport system substrate-binding protein
MDTWSILPVYYMNSAFLIKDYVQNVDITPAGTKYFYRAQLGEGRDTMNVFMAAEPSSLDPALASTVADMSLAANSFEGLMTYDSEGQLQCAQAEKYEVSEDGLNYTFTLRDGLKWSNGEPLTAADFAYAWKRAADVNNASGYAYLFDVFEDGQYDDEGNLIALGDGAIDVSEDGKTITAHLKSVCPYFLDLCAFPTFFPVYEASSTSTATEGLPTGTWANDAGDAYVCNGAYTLSAWNHDSDMTYVKNENYRGAADVSVNTLNFMLTSDNATAFSAYQAGDLDFLSEIPTDEMDKLLADNSPELHTVPSLGTYFIACQYNAPFYQELGLTEDQAKVFRHALCLLIDRQNLIDTVGKTGQHMATSFVPEGCADGNGGEFKNKDYFSVDDYDANVEEAKSLLESIGLWDGSALTQPVSFNILTNDTESNIKLCEQLQQDWGQLGMDVTINKEESGTYFADRKAGNFDVARANWMMDYNDPINMLEMWASTSSNDYVYLGR